jgi:hypothetical protein
MSPEHSALLHRYLLSQWIPELKRQNKLLAAAIHSFFDHTLTPGVLRTETTHTLIQNQLDRIETLSLIGILQTLSCSSISEAKQHWSFLKSHLGGQGLHGLAHYAAACGAEGLQWASRSYVPLNSLSNHGKSLFESSISRNTVNVSVLAWIWIHVHKNTHLPKQSLWTARAFFNRLHDLAAAHAESALGFATQILNVNAPSLKQNWTVGQHQWTQPYSIMNSISSCLNYFYQQPQNTPVVAAHRHEFITAFESLLERHLSTHGFSRSDSAFFEQHISDPTRFPVSKGLRSSFRLYEQMKLTDDSSGVSFSKKRRSSL